MCSYSDHQDSQRAKPLRPINDTLTSSQQGNLWDPRFTPKGSMSQPPLVTFEGYPPGHVTHFVIETWSVHVVLECSWNISCHLSKDNTVSHSLVCQINMINVCQNLIKSFVLDPRPINYQSSCISSLNKHGDVHLQLSVDDTLINGLMAVLYSCSRLWPIITPYWLLMVMTISMCQLLLYCKTNKC